MNQQQRKYTFEETESFCYHSFMEKEGLHLLQQFFAMGNLSAPEELRKKRKKELLLEQKSETLFQVQ